MTPRRRPPAAKTGSSRNGAEGSVYRRIAAFVVRRDRGICHICGHSGAKVPDHLVPVAERPDLALDAGNMKAAHGYLKNGGGECPVCSPAAVARGGKVVYCNELRGALSVERARRVIETRTGLAIARGDGQPRGERDWLPVAAVLVPAAVPPLARLPALVARAGALPVIRGRLRSLHDRFLPHMLQPAALSWQCFPLTHPLRLNIPHEQVHRPRSARYSRLTA